MADVAPKKVIGAATSKVRTSSAGGHVIVASKLPVALVLRIQKKEIRRSKDRNTVIEEEIWVADPEWTTVTIAGNAYPVGAPPEGMVWPDRPDMAAGYALTHGVPQDLWDYWLEQNAGTPMVKNKLVMAFEKREDAVYEAKNNKAVQSGLQAMVRDTDPRWPKKLSAIEARKNAEEPADAE